MTKTKKVLGAALLALALLPAAVLVFHIQLVPALLMLGTGIAGTVTVTYASFQDGSGLHGGFTGGTTAPTQAQSATVNAVVAQVSMADTDTTATVTHNFGLTAAQAAALQPYITHYIQSLGSNTTAPVFTFALTNTNVITVNKVSNTGTGGTLVVIVRRPQTISS